MKSSSDNSQESLNGAQQACEALGMLLSAVGQSRMSVWTYDFQTRSISFGGQSCDYHHLQERGMLFPDLYPEQGFVHPDDAEKFREMLQRVHSGEPVVSEEIRYLTLLGDISSSRWERTIFSTVMDNSGKPCKAYCSSKDITEQKLMEHRLNKEIARLHRAKTETEYPAFIIFNATKDIIIDHEPGGFPIQTLTAGCSMDEERKMLPKMSLTENDLNKFKDCFDRELILGTYRDGGSLITREYRRPGKEEGTVIWARSTVNIVQDPQSAEIICFGYTTDITDERTREAMLDTMLTDEYEYVMYIDLKADSFKTFANKYGGTLLPEAKGHYSTMIRDFVRDCYAPEDVKLILERTSPEGIRQQLRYAESFETIGRTLEEDGSRSIKKIRCGYIDKEREIVYSYRMDITDLFEKEQEQKQALAAALDAAKRTNEAKSRFIARMSRDMRTPMTEILGLTRLTLERSDLTREVRENIEQALRSASYLQELINDVLDLGRIESGEISLHYEMVNLRDFFAKLLKSFSIKALEENISFSFDTQAAGFETVYMEKLRVWQVFSKLLSSAIKLSHGAELYFKAECMGMEQDYLGYCFTIRQSPVTQGNLVQLLESATGQGRVLADDADDVGLAMPIITNLVEKMGGCIESGFTGDGGTEIILRLGFRVSEDQPVKAAGERDC